MWWTMYMLLVTNKEVADAPSTNCIEKRFNKMYANLIGWYGRVGVIRVRGNWLVSATCNNALHTALPCYKLDNSVWKASELLSKLGFLWEDTALKDFYVNC